MKKKINFAYLFFILFFSFIENQHSFAQLTKEDKLDSVRAVFVQDSSYIYRHRDFGFLFAIDQRNSFIHTDTKASVKVSGVQIGVVVDERQNIGIGFYAIANTKQIQSTVDSKQKLNSSFTMGYATLFWEYTFVDTRFWEIGVPLEIGAGSYQHLVTDSSGKRAPEFKDTAKKGILLLGAGLNVDFKIFKWIGLNAMGGYRVVGGNEPNKVNFNGVFYSVGMHFYFGELVKIYKLHRKRERYKDNVMKINNEYG